MNVLLLLKNLSRFGGHPLYDSLHSSTKLLILIDSDYEANSKVPVAAPLVTAASGFHLPTFTYQ